MNKYVLGIIFFVLFFVFLLVFPNASYAIENPLEVPNNKIGIHILFPDEILQAAPLVNSNGGDWGYVTIPIQAGDKDLDKWQTFMDTARKYHIIPIIRLATEGDYFNTKVWRKPNEADILDFVNFLNSLVWPAKNRYVVVFNEVNRSDEWGGETNPGEYARLLNYAVSVFKSKSDDFFIISAGLDNASINYRTVSYNKFDFLRLMNDAVPGIFNQVDGLSSHSYPNPAFAKPPTIQDSQSIASFRFEKAFVQNFTSKDLPIFITETGWSKDRVSDDVQSAYYTQAFETVWNDPTVVAVTPFLLKAGIGPFAQFSFLNSLGLPSQTYLAIASMKKVQGFPILVPQVVTSIVQNVPESDVRTFQNESVLSAAKNDASSQSVGNVINIPQSFKMILKWLLRL